MAKLEKIIKYGLYAAFLLPLIFTSKTMFPWHFGKTILFQVSVEILLVLALMYFSFQKESKLIKLNLLDWLIIGFLSVQIISSIFGVDFNKSFWGNQQRAQGVFTWIHFTIFYLLLRQFFISPKDWRNLGAWVIGIGFISIFLAWFGQYFSFFDGIIIKGFILSGMFGNPIFFASYLIIPIFLSFSLFFLFEDKSKIKWFFPVFSLLGLITLFYTQTRGAFIGLSAGVFIGWLLFLFYGKKGKIRSAMAIAGMLLLLLAAGVYIANQKTDFFKKNTPLISRLFSISIKETTANTRIMAWEIAIKGWKDKPFLGWGPENYEDVFDRHYNLKYLKYSFAETVWDKPHNLYLEFLSTTGLLGFVCFLSIFITAFYCLFNKIKKEDNEKKKFFLIIVTGLFAAYAIQNIFAMESSSSLELWFFILAFISFICAKNNGKIELYPELIKNKLAWVALIALIAAPFYIYKNYTFYNASVLAGTAEDYAEIESLYKWRENAEKVLDAKVPFMWEQAIILTKSLANFDGKGILDKKTIEPVGSKMEKIFDNSAADNPASYLMRFWAGQFYSFMGEYVDLKYYEKSEKMLREATAINTDRQNVAFILAKTYILQGKNKEGIEVLEELVRKNPDYNEPHWFLGLALMQGGQADRGMEELEKGMVYGAGFNDNNVLYLIDLYAGRKEYEKIIPLYERLIVKNPSNPQYYASLAAVYAELGKDDEAVKALQKAIEIQPELQEQAKEFLKEKNIDINKYK